MNTKKTETENTPIHSHRKYTSTDDIIPLTFLVRLPLPVKYIFVGERERGRGVRTNLDTK